MAADVTTVTKRVTEALNVCSPGTFSVTVASTNLDRVSTAIDEYVREAALDIAAAICSNPKHPHRNLYISASPTSLTHGGELPDMAGENDLIEIQKYSGGSFVVGLPKDAQQIDSYRENPSSLYGSVSHTTQNSPLAGFYNISNGRFRFTGFAAQIYSPSISRSTVTGLIPDEYEGAWFMGGLGYAMKEGDNLADIAMYYMGLFRQSLVAITANTIVSPATPIEKAMRARGDS